MNRTFRLVIPGLMLLFVCLAVAACSKAASVENVDPIVDGQQDGEEEQMENIQVAEEEPIVEEPVKKWKVVIDPGHGGEDPGSEGASGAYEKDFNLSLSLKIAEQLKKEEHIELHMTRDKDIFLSSETRDRPNFANNIGADLYVSIHANTFVDPTVTGTETFYYDDPSKLLADIVHRHVAQATGFRDRGVSQEEFFVLKDTHMPAILIEVGYISNPIDEAKMLTDSFQQSVAEAVVAGIKEYIDLMERQTGDVSEDNMAES